jgi:hypothetical protein
VRDVSVVMDKRLSFFEYHAGIEKEFAIIPGINWLLG